MSSLEIKPGQTCSNCGFGRDRHTGCEDGTCPDMGVPHICPMEHAPDKQEQS